MGDNCEDKIYYILKKLITFKTDYMNLHIVL